MTEKLREKINSILHSYISYNLDETILIEPELIATQILLACKEFGLVQLDENQELPNLEIVDGANLLGVSIATKALMLDAGFKRVKEIEV